MRTRMLPTNFWKTERRRILTIVGSYPTRSRDNAWSLQFDAR